MKRKSEAEHEFERSCESGYEWPRARRISIYIYPAQMKMIDEISRVWKKKRRDVFFEAIQQYIGFYWRWKNEPASKEERK